ncbi:hypothetical protein F383_33766 [Gossypium arboreum]|uniref:Uncharacterized protein n=1 Tax=Gossypium arboreum TaxID=29729 RepID=A0A0B0PPY2_GOSAR|nr:hypothetical protein F383_33766 [Gossypium arboreum]
MGLSPNSVSTYIGPKPFHKSYHWPKPLL